MDQQEELQRQLQFSFLPLRIPADLRLAHVQEARVCQERCRAVQETTEQLDLQARRIKPQGEVVGRLTK
jgi:hypothetical protein